MAFSSILRRLASSFSPLVVRPLRSQRICQMRIVSSEPRLSPFLPPPCSYSTKWPSSDDENLLRVLDEEIQCAKATVDRCLVEVAPNGFPFKIEDKLGSVTITLSREYEGEEINVEVDPPKRVTSDDIQDYSDVKESIPLVISVANGKGQFIKFDCTSYTDNLDIDCLGVKNPENSGDQIACEGRRDLDENLQKAFRKYLAIRGIRASATNFLYYYMINKCSRDHLMWLKMLKEFVEA